MYKGAVAFVIFTALILTLACATEAPVRTSTPCNRTNSYSR